MKSLLLFAALFGFVLLANAAPVEEEPEGEEGEEGDYYMEEQPEEEEENGEEEEIPGVEEPEEVEQDGGDLIEARKRYFELRKRNRFRNWAGRVGRVAGHVGKAATGICKFTDRFSRGSNNC